MKFEQMLKQNVSKDLKKFSHLLQYLRRKMISVAPLSRRFFFSPPQFSLWQEKNLFFLPNICGNPRLWIIITVRPHAEDDISLI